MPTPVILVLDAGKTNKKWMLFDRSLHPVGEGSVRLPETSDEDGFPCEDIALLSAWVRDTVEAVRGNPRYRLDAVNCSAYGASLVYLDRHGNVLTPLYNYLKPFPDYLRRAWSERHGSAEALALETASPGMDSLNSGMQLYRFKLEQPTRFGQLACALHLPQYLSFCLTGQPVSDYTSIGCHTALWNFRAKGYHRWVVAEGLDRCLAPLIPTTRTIPVRMNGRAVSVGVGIHDSSAALLPHLHTSKESFILLSTGTWNISLNPFDDTPLSPEACALGCLCYLQPDGRPVKASRLFVGAWNSPMEDLIAAQQAATRLVWNGPPVRKLIVTGGYGANETFLAHLRDAFPGTAVEVAEVTQASALGAALVISPGLYAP